MRGLGGFVLLAGIATGLFVYFPAPVDRSTSLEQATRAVATRAADEERIPLAPAAPQFTRLASFSPAVPLADPQRRKRTAAAPVAAPAATAATVSSWQTTTVAAAPLEPADTDSRYKLVVDIQQELKRVGCYSGRANGAWNASTRSAMREFTTRANAALATDRPDYTLLTLLKSNGGRSCGAPEAIVAAAPPAEVLPWKTAAATPQPASRLYTPVPTSAVTTEPLPGRMSIGGPRDFALPEQAPLVPPAHGQQTAALDHSAPSGGSPRASAPKPRHSSSGGSGSKKSSWHKPAQGTPRYNLMLSLGGVY